MLLFFQSSTFVQKKSSKFTRSERMDNLAVQCLRCLLNLVPAPRPVSPFCFFNAISVECKIQLYFLQRRKLSTDLLPNEYFNSQVKELPSPPPRAHTYLSSLVIKLRYTRKRSQWVKQQQPGFQGKQTQPLGRSSFLFDSHRPVKKKIIFSWGRKIYGVASRLWSSTELSYQHCEE